MLTQRYASDAEVSGRQTGLRWSSDVKHSAAHQLFLSAACPAPSAASGRLLCDSVSLRAESIMDRLTVWEKVTAEFDGRPVSGSYAVDGEMVKVITLNGQKATQVGVFNTTCLARYLLRELAVEGKA